MAVTLLDEITEAETRLAELKRRAAGATCAEVGHRWEFIGGRNAACGRGRDCGCSVPVSECTACGDCDYGDTPARAEIIVNCHSRN